jgi:hypothetical protein
MAVEDDLFAVPGGPLVLERTDRFAKHLRATLRPPGGPARPAPLVLVVARVIDPDGRRRIAVIL